MARSIFTDTVDLDQAGDAFAPQMPRDAVSMSVQAAIINGAWTSAVLSIEVSNDGNAYFDLPAGAVTFTGDGITSHIDVRAYAFVRAHVSTAHSGAGLARVHFAFTDKGASDG